MISSNCQFPSLVLLNLAKFGGILAMTPTGPNGP